MDKLYLKTTLILPEDFLHHGLHERHSSNIACVWDGTALHHALNLVPQGVLDVRMPRELVQRPRQRAGDLKRGMRKNSYLDMQK